MVTFHPTLSSADYCSDAVFDAERTRLFHHGWMLIDRADSLQPGNRKAIDVVGESVLLTRTLDGRLFAHANVCRHRGARLCDEQSSSTQGSIMCPYHAWTYALDGSLIATPHLDNEQVDKSQLSLWSIALREWQGFVFVSLNANPPDFDEWMAADASELLALQRFQFGDLVIGRTTHSTASANWKILVENYQECLHCTRVHPELVQIIPSYRSGWVLDHDRPDGSVTLRDQGTSFTTDGNSALPILPHMIDDDAHCYRGSTVYPNAFVDVTGTCVIVTIMFPNGPNKTTIVTQYLFAASTVEDDNFDPSEVVDFSEMVAGQDIRVCEIVQRGVASKYFTNGILTPKDDLVINYTQHYLDAMQRP